MVRILARSGGAPSSLRRGVAPLFAEVYHRRAGGPVPFAPSVRTEQVRRIAMKVFNFALDP
jgi:hypothetical protein